MLTEKIVRYGGHIEITKHYARSLLRRMGFMKRKGTKAVKNLPSDFDEMKNEFINRVEKSKDDYSVPDSMIFNWDQTGYQLVPGEDWTIGTKSTNKVIVAGIEIPVLLCIAESGTLLPIDITR